MSIIVIGIIKDVITSSIFQKEYGKYLKVAQTLYCYFIFNIFSNSN